MKETVLHIFTKTDHARAIVEGTPVPMKCGFSFYVETVKGEPVLPNGGAVCLECLDAIGPEQAAKIITRRHAKKLEVMTDDVHS